MDLGNPLDFTGRAVVVTGGTKGIGAAIARAFLAAGADVLVCGRNAPAVLPSSAGRPCAFRATDVRDPEEAAALVETAVARFGRLDVLVNNAGGAPAVDAATASPRFVEKVVALNLLAPFYVAQAANRVMQSQDEGGCVINIGSVAARTPQPGTAAYTAAKAGLLGLTRALALEWAPLVRVNHITTGLIRTESAAEVYGEYGGAAVAAVVPMRRMAAPYDVAHACLYLASGLSAYVNGADLAVHGGGEVPGRHLAARRPATPFRPLDDINGSHYRPGDDNEGAEFGWPTSPSASDGATCAPRRPRTSATTSAAGSATTAPGSASGTGR